MSSAPYHKDHQAIRDTLYSLNILDTPLEERFQRITRLVCASLGVPISAFSIIDGERQWFKSIQGLDATENTRVESFCAYTILGDDIMIVPDTHADKRFSSNPLVTGDPNIGFYAGCPIRAPDGRNIGSLCAIDRQTKVLTADQVQVLKDLALMLESELKVAQLSKSQHELITELNATQRLLIIDPLTRLWNKSGLADILKREWSSSQRKNSVISALLCDIDDLGRMTDRLGRGHTEQVIKEIAKRFLTVLRAEDAIGRIDGDRFLMILPDSNPDKIMDRAALLCRNVVSKPVRIGDVSERLNIKFRVMPKIGDPASGLDHLLEQIEKLPSSR